MIYRCKSGPTLGSKIMTVTGGNNSNKNDSTAEHMSTPRDRKYRRTVYLWAPAAFTARPPVSNTTLIPRLGYQSGTMRVCVGLSVRQMLSPLNQNTTKYLPHTPFNLPQNANHQNSKFTHNSNQKSRPKIISISENKISL